MSSEIEKIIAKFNAKIVEECPKCGKFGILRWRRAGSHTEKNYFYVHARALQMFFGGSFLYPLKMNTTSQIYDTGYINVSAAN
jgi:hypothetical protein